MKATVKVLPATRLAGGMGMDKDVPKASELDTPTVCTTVTPSTITLSMVRTRESNNATSMPSCSTSIVCVAVPARVHEAKSRAQSKCTCVDRTACQFEKEELSTLLYALFAKDAIVSSFLIKKNARRDRMMETLRVVVTECVLCQQLCPLFEMLRTVLLALFALVALFCGSSNAFAPRPSILTVTKAAPRAVSSLSVFGGRGKAKTPAPVEDNDYWQGDWVCADCGYVFDRDIDGGGLYFEQQKKGFICPQCRCGTSD